MAKNYPVGNPLLKKSFSKKPDVEKLNQIMQQLKQQQQETASKKEKSQSS
jgi:hypothetical protein